MPLSRMLNSTFAMPNIIDSHDMGLRTVLQSRRPKVNAYSTPIPARGHPRITTPNEDRYLAVTAKKKQTEHSIRPVSSATGTTVSRQTVYRRLRHIGLYARRPVRCVPLTATHCRLRLTWSREHAL
ncbi:transposable element Tcb2 transposase [Trichonephila clavipes]|nr:transposable element Tcb2 transposase [Trichonephila clavipes]